MTMHKSHKTFIN